MVLTTLQELATGFEGCEKKVEIDFCISDAVANGQDLRDIPRHAIDAILALAKCTIISIKKNKYFTAYLLSESSLFIYPSKILLKTCGTTLLLKCVGSILAAARAVGAQPDFLQFSRSNFMFPQKQHFPHRAFTEETEYLNKLLGVEGDAFILGPLQGPRWHLYIVDFNTVSAAEYKQQTLEMIMFNLNRDVMKIFTRKADDSSSSSDEKKELVNTSGQCFDNTSGVGSSSGEDATTKSGIHLLLPGSDIDGFLFTPCGYSCNGLNEQTYFTIHITPEPECSFVSFETNLNAKSFSALVKLVVNTFKPGSFCLSLFVDEQSIIRDSRTGLDWTNVEGYVAKATTHHTFAAGYNATCAHYDAIDLYSNGGSNGSTPTASSKFNPLYGLGASTALAAPKPSLHPLDGLVGPASYATITSLPEQQLVSLAQEAARSYVEIESPLDSKEMENEESADKDPSSDDLIAQCAVGVLARHQPEQSFLLVDLGQLTRRFRDWAKQYPRVQPFYSMGSTGVDTGMLCVLSALGVGFSFASANQISTVIGAGVPAHRMMFERAFLPSPLLRLAHDSHIEFVTYSSQQELQSFAIHHPKAKLLLRVNIDSNPSDYGALGVSLQQVPLLLLAAKGLALNVVGVRLNTSSGSTDVKAFQAALQGIKQAFDAAVHSHIQLHVLDLGASLATFDAKDAKSVSETLDALFPESIRVHADASQFLQHQTHTLHLTVLAKQQMPAASASEQTVAVGSKRKSFAVESTQFQYYVSSPLGPQHHVQSAQVKPVTRSNTSKSTHSSAIVPICQQDHTFPPVSCTIAELNVGDWVYVSECAHWLPGALFAPNQPLALKGNQIEPLTYYMWS